MKVEESGEGARLLNCTVLNFDWSMPTASRELKIVVLGTGGVGKSALSLQFVQSIFIEKYDPTIEDSYRKVVEVPGEWLGSSGMVSLVLEIMDTAGTEQFTAMRDLYMRSGDAFMLVYSVDSIGSLEALQPLHEQLVRVHPNAPVLLVGNKCDLQDERQVSSQIAIQTNNLWRLPSPPMETSARKNINVAESFMKLVQIALRQSMEATTVLGNGNGIGKGKGKDKDKLAKRASNQRKTKCILQ